MASLFVEYYPSVHKTTDYRVVVKDDTKKRVGQMSILSNKFMTLAEVLKSNGYQTAGFSANPHIWDRTGFAQGFDHFDNSFAGNTVRGELVNQSLFKWLAEERDCQRPLFLYLHYMDVHAPYDAAPRFMDPQMKRIKAQPQKRELTEAEWAELIRFPRYPPPEGHRSPALQASETVPRILGGAVRRRRGGGGFLPGSTR